MFKHFFKWLGIENQYQARNIKQKLSMIYAFVGWNCFVVIFYNMMKQNIPEESLERKKVYQQLISQAENTHVFELEGLKTVKEYDIKFEDITTHDNRNVKIDENL